MSHGILPLVTSHCGGSTMICPSPERREREDFAYDVCACMRGHVFPVAAWETIGLPVDACMGPRARARVKAEHRNLPLTELCRP